MKRLCFFFFLIMVSTTGFSQPGGDAIVAEKVKKDIYIVFNKRPKRNTDEETRTIIGVDYVGVLATDRAALYIRIIYTPMQIIDSGLKPKLPPPARSHSRSQP